MRKEREMDALEAKAVREQFERAGNLYQKLTDRQKKEGQRIDSAAARAAGERRCAA